MRQFEMLNRTLAAESLVLRPLAGEWIVAVLFLADTAPIGSPLAQGGS